MKHWNILEDAKEIDVPMYVLEVAEAVLEALDDARANGAAAGLTQLAWSDDEDDSWLYELDVQLAPGVILPSEHGLLDLIGEEGWEDGGLDAVVEEVIEGVMTCAPRAAELADIVHEARVRARQAIAGWRGAASSLRLVDVRLAPYEHWRGDEQPNLIALVEDLNDLLKPEIRPVYIGKIANLEAEIQGHLEAAEVAFARRAQLMRSGASGTVDQLAINALASFGDPAEALRRFAEEWRFWLPDDTAVVMMNGHVQAGNSRIDDAVQWDGDWVSVRNLYLHPAASKAAVGGPVSDLFDHPFLSPDMTVLEARSGVDRGVPTLNIRYTVTRRLFCSSTGRVWDEPACENATAPTIGDGTVIAFRKRRSAI